MAGLGVTTTPNTVATVGAVVATSEPLDAGAADGGPMPPTKGASGGVIVTFTPGLGEPV